MKSCSSKVGRFHVDQCSAKIDHSEIFSKMFPQSQWGDRKLWTYRWHVMSLKLQVQLTDYSLFRLFNAMLMALQKALSKIWRPINAVATVSSQSIMETEEEKLGRILIMLFILNFDIFFIINVLYYFFKYCIDISTLIIDSLASP